MLNLEFINGEEALVEDGYWHNKKERDKRARQLRKDGYVVRTRHLNILAEDFFFLQGVKKK